MYLRLVSILLATLLASFWETAGVAETTRTTNELIGPVRSVTIKKLGYSTTETYDRAGHLIEAVIDMAYANTATYSLFRYDQDGHLQEELALDPGLLDPFAQDFGVQLLCALGELLAAHDRAGRLGLARQQLDRGDHQVPPGIRNSRRRRSAASRLRDEG